MPFNSQPIRPVSEQDIDTYARDGVVCLRKVLHPDWIASLEPVARRLLIDKQDFGLLPTYPGRYMSRTIPEFRRFVFESAIAEAGAGAIGSRTARFFFDEIFAKGPQSTESTIWHTDRMGWPTTGVMVPSIWVPLTPITEANSLECVAGSQTDDKRYWLFSPNARKMIKPTDRPGHPDGEALRKDPKVRFLKWNMEPGDILVVHPWTMHYSHGNPTDDWRIAISVRIFGDDIRFAPRPDCVNLAGVSLDEMIEGESPDGPLFPMLYNADGKRDDDSEFPRGFATRWKRARLGDVNEYETFEKSLKAQRTA